MTFMMLAAMAVVATAPVPATPDAVQMELGQLQSRAQALVSTVNTQTQVQDVQTALGTSEGSVDQSCRSICSRTFQGGGGKAVPFATLVLQYSAKQNINTYHYDRPFEPEEVLVELDIADTATSGACFSQASWNAALIRAGWEPLKPFDEVLKVKVTDDKDAFDKNDDSAARLEEIHVHGFATRRGDRYLTLSPIVASYWNAGLVLAPALQADLAQGDCLRTVITDRHMAKKGYEASQAPKPAA